MNSSLYFEISRYRNTLMLHSVSITVSVETWTILVWNTERDCTAINREFYPLRVLTSANFYRECRLKWQTIVRTYQLSWVVATPFRNRCCIVIWNLHNFGECHTFRRRRHAKIIFMFFRTNRNVIDTLFISRNYISWNTIIWTSVRDNRQTIVASLSTRTISSNLSNSIDEFCNF